MNKKRLASRMIGAMFAGVTGYGICIAAGPLTQPAASPPQSASAAPGQSPTTRASTTRPASPATRAASDDEVARLVKQLAADQWRTRRDAQRQLAQLGPDIEPQLRKLRQSPTLDPEARKDIDTLLAAFATDRRTGPSRVTLALKSAAPWTAFEAIEQQTSIHFAPGTQDLFSDAKPIDINVRRVPFWEAFEQLCSKSNVSLSSIDPKGVLSLQRLSAGAVAAPAAVSGPFMVSIDRVELNFTKTKAFAGQRPQNLANNNWNHPPCRLYLFAHAEPRMQASRWFVDGVEECTTDPVPVEVARGDGSGTSGRVNAADETTMQFQGNWENVRRIKKLRLAARFAMIRNWKHLKIDNVMKVKNATYMIGDFRMVFKGVQKTGSDAYEYELSVSRDANSPAAWETFRSMMDEKPHQLLDAKGKELEARGSSTSWGSDEITMSQTLSAKGFNGGKLTGEPASFVWDLPVKVEQSIVHLEFTNVPMP